MKIIITGAAGLVGQNLAPLLLAEGHDITCIDKNKNNLSLLKKLNPQVITLEADLSKKGQWEKEFIKKDVVIQLQAQIAARKKEPFTKNNVTSVREILRICKEHKTKHLIHLSSSVVISVADDDYTNTKRKGEELVTNSTIPYTILRPPLLYGPFGVKHLGWLTRFLEKSPVFPLPGFKKVIRQPLYVKDLCNVIASAIHKGPHNTTYNVIGHEKIPYKNIIKKLAQERKLTRLIIPLPLWLFKLLLNCYALSTKKPAFTKDQLTALTAGDEFPVENWTKTFNVAYTPFAQGIRKTIHSPQYQHRDNMESPH